MSARNVLLITADQWRHECLSCLDHPVVRTPALDRLAAEAVLFRNHFTQCTPCGPSRASLLTGQYLMNHRSGRNGTPLDRRFTNVALEMRRAGYDSALIGYTDTSLDPRDFDPADPLLTTYSGDLPGFRQLVPGSQSEAAWVRWLAGLDYEVPARTADMYLGDPAKGDPVRGPYHAPTRFPTEHGDTAFHTNKAIDYLSEQGERPWFLHLSLLRPHWPWYASAPYNDLYHPNQVPAAVGQADKAAESAVHPHVAYVVRHGARDEDHPPEVTEGDDVVRRQCRATYYGMISEVDHHLGRLFDHLHRLGRWEDTLIIFTTDHGEQLWDHWVLGKQAPFDQSFHIPLIVRAPGESGSGGRGAQVEAFTEAVDIMPTILQAVGRPVPRQCDGAALLPFLNGTTPAGWRTEVHWELDFRDTVTGRAEAELGLDIDSCNLTTIRDARWKYVHYAGLPPLLFDIAKDPDETTNLAEDPAHAVVVRTMAQKMLSWRMRNADRTLSHILITPQGPIEREPPPAAGQAVADRAAD